MKILPNNDRLHLECAGAENALCSITRPAEQVSSLHEILGGTYLRLQPLDEQRNVADRVSSEVDMFQRYEQAGLVKPGATGKRSRQVDARSSYIILRILYRRPNCRGFRSRVFSVAVVAVFYHVNFPSTPSHY